MRGLRNLFLLASYLNPVRYIFFFWNHPTKDKEGERSELFDYPDECIDAAQEWLDKGKYNRVSKMYEYREYDNKDDICHQEYIHMSYEEWKEIYEEEEK
ncbi:hypothetical protein H6G33_10120 [Calothrix sp. FACHB-1219]|uniref:hypothetical protein n=1 Tax=unclassified Calothrix TaxID=2619626 RepID=UPI0016834BD6|nr:MULTISPECIES: hypothetical protein [unclassified Calothrix]MBD2201703.1 hypothetical protein [Calothrix sp. FACHB-168]MBD2217389.1 hypothetical protein [Calothrix sp. FACHB-1219]